MSTELAKHIFTFPFDVVRDVTQDALRARALELRVFDEAKLAERNPYFFPATISNNRFDSHSTRMAVSSLRNYAREAEEGVSFLYSHDREEIVGHSMGGRFVNGQGNGVAHVDADFYLIPGLRLGTVESDQVILGIDTRVLRYVSIGFWGGEWICSICGFDIWNFEECRHYPGYTFKVQADGETKDVLCTADVEDAHLAEVSSVYKGSTPGAIITKAEHDARAGLLAPSLRSAIERRFHVTLPNKGVAVGGHSTTQEDSQMSQERQQSAGPKPGANGGGASATDTPEGGGERAGGGSADETLSITSETLTPHAPILRALLAEAGIPEAQGERQLDVTARVRQLIGAAKDGAAYRRALIKQALDEGVRAYGTGFKREVYQRTLEASDIETIQVYLEDWTREAKAKNPGGRQTVDSTVPVGETRGGDAKPAAQPQRGVPRSAYKTRPQ
jgi:hypothetical protein